MKTLNLLFKAVLSASVLWTADISLAKEGFYQGPGEGLSENSWSGTMGIYANKVAANPLDQPTMGIGSGAIIAVEKNADGTKTYITILTVAHNFFPIINDKIMEQISEHVVASALIVSDFQSQQFIKERTQFQIVADHLQILKYDIEKDLALVRGELNSDLKQEISIIPVAEDCDLKRGDTLMAIGYPSTDLRTVKNVSIKDSDWTLKRWSLGVFTGSTLESTDRSQASYDCLAGCSGGPVLNSRNELVGIHQKSPRVDGLAYLGNDKLLGPHSTFGSCRSIQNFIQQFLKDPHPI